MDINALIAPEPIAALFTRVLLGILLFIQGYDKIFKIKITNVIDTVKPSYQKMGIPLVLIIISSYVTSYIELLGGFFLIIGLFKYVSLYMLGIDLIFVSMGMSLINSVWNMELVLPRFILLLFLLIFPAEYDVFTLQNALNHLR